jgi:CheY-like chemotaxis protein
MLFNNTHGLKALVVEDEPVICRVCQKTLVADGYIVDIASTGLIAKGMVNDARYDLVFSDIRTPQMNGIELYHYLAEAHPDLARRVIFTTGDVLSGNIGEFLAETNQPYLAKPFTPDQLRQTVHLAWEQWSGRLSGVR